MFLETQEVAHLRRRRQWRQELDCGGVDDTAPALLRVRDSTARARSNAAAPPSISALHAGEGGIAAARGGEVHDPAVVVDECADALCAGRQ